MTGELQEMYIALGISLLSLIASCIVLRIPHRLFHQWEKWQEIPPDPIGIQSLYLIQERCCKTCGLNKDEVIDKVTGRLALL